MHSVCLFVRIVRLPLDLVLLTVDFLHVAVWLGKDWMSRLTGIAADPYQPCTRGAAEELDGEGIRRCQPVTKYGNPEILRLLCGRVWNREIPDKGPCRLCGRQEDLFRISLFRFLGAGLLIGLIWVLIAAAVLWPFRQRLGRLARAWRTPQGVVERGRPPGPAQESPARARELVERGTRLRDEGNTAEARLAFRSALQHEPRNAAAQLGLARCAEELGNDNEARQAYRQALELQPDLVSARLALAGLAYAAGDLDEADRQARQVLESDPDQAAAHILLSDCALARRELDAAATEAKLALDLEPDNVKAMLAAGNAALARSEPDKAERLYRSVLDREDSVVARIGLARITWATGDETGTLMQLEKARQAYPTDARVVKELAEYHAARQDTDRAIAVYREFTEGMPTAYWARARLAELLIGARQIDAGYCAAQELLEDQPGHVAAHLILADLLRRLGLHTEAVNHAKKAVVQAPRELRAHKLLARVQMERGDLEEATGNLEELHVLVPDDLEILMNLGVCYERGDRADAAMDMYRQAVAASPEAALPHLRIGLLHWKEGRAAEAISTYRHALELAPDSIEATNNLAMLLLDANGDRQEALALARRAAEAAPNSMSILDTLGWALCQDGQYDQAVGLLVRTTKGQPDNPTPFYHLAVALRGAGKLAEARSALQKALAISPQFEKADDARRLMAEVSAALRGE